MANDRLAGLSICVDEHLLIKQGETEQKPPPTGVWGAILLGLRGVSWFSFLLSISTLLLAITGAGYQWWLAVQDDMIPPANWYETGEMHGPWRHYANDYIGGIIVTIAFTCVFSFVSLICRPSWRAGIVFLFSFILTIVAFNVGLWLED